MSPSAGRAFGGYRLLRSIASDAISTTYHAMPNDPGAADDAHRPRFTVRVIGRLLGDDEHADELVERFVAGVQKAGAIDHPSIVRPRDVGVIDGHPYVVTPFVRAVPLGDMLGHGGAINESAALALFAQLAGGLDVAHRAGVVHGTVSPTTIWVGPSTGSGAAYVGYLTGFAASELLRERLATDARSDPLPDVLYVAPEQLRGEPASGASDQYALACALYHTLAGEPPFRAATRSKLYGAHLMTAPPVLRDIDAAAAPSTSAALRRGMEKHPTRRHASCGMLINAALPDRSDGASATVSAPASPPATGAAVKVGRRGQRRQMWPLLLVGLGIVLLGVVLWLQLASA